VKDLLIAGIVLLLAYAVLHVHHYRRHRRAGMGVFYSMAGPFHTRVTVRRRVRLGHVLAGAVVVVAVVFAAGVALGGHP